MNNGEKRLTQQQILALSFVIAITMLYLAIVLPRMLENKVLPPALPAGDSSSDPEAAIPVEPPTQSVESDTPQTVEPNESSTPQPQTLLVPIVGTSGFNLPRDFRVGSWHDNNCDFVLFPKYVYIYGVEIQGGTPPFEFTFWQGDTVTAPFSATPQNGEIKFKTPVKLNRGPYNHVKITFQSLNGPSQWEDDLRYPNDPQCLIP